MARWEPDSRSRLEEAALALYAERGFDNTTVAEIAERAGVTERTFFRHFADKREVLFGGGPLLQDLMVGAVANAPKSHRPIDVVESALEATVPLFEARRDRVRQRQAVIAANPELQERELVKLASLSAGVAAALRARGVKEPAATLTAEAGMTVFRVAFDRWAGGRDKRGLAQLIRQSLEELRLATAG